MEVLISENNINRYIVPYLSTGKREGKFKVNKSSIVAALLHKLNIGCQWRQLPIREFFDGYRLSGQGVYYHFRRWVQDGSLRKVWVELLKHHPRSLDLSSVQVDGSQTIRRKGGECVGYQPRKAATSCNSLFLADNKGLMLAYSCPLAGQHYDLFQIEQLFKKLWMLLKEAGITTDSLFLNADAGFDSQEFRRQYTELKIETNIKLNPRKAEPPDEYRYFDEELFKRRKVITWLDSFKALLVRFKTKARH